jgi:elongation factor Ts
VSREEVPEKALKDEREVAAAQIKGKPEAVVEKIVAGKVEKYYSTVCLMEQAFVKDANLTMKDIISSKIGELGENIVVRRFTRFAVGEGAETKTEESGS